MADSPPQQESESSPPHKVKSESKTRHLAARRLQDEERAREILLSKGALEPVNGAQGRKLGYWAPTLYDRKGNWRVPYDPNLVVYESDAPDARIIKRRSPEPSGAPSAFSPSGERPVVSAPPGAGTAGDLLQQSAYPHLRKQAALDTKGGVK